MLRVAVDQLTPGMRVGRSVCDTRGRILLTAGTVLKPQYIERLRQLGIPAVYIWNDLAPDVVPEDIISPETRQELAAEVKQAMEELRRCLTTEGRNRLRRWQMATQAVQQAVGRVVEEILANRFAVVHLRDIRTHDEYLLGHSVNVCVLSVLIGCSLGLGEAELRELGLGAVLHDVGKLTVPVEILNKTEPLTPEQMEEIRQHTVRGFEILKACPGISYPSAHVAYQHHERWCGGGYPRGLAGNDIHPYARIVAVADVYDAMTSDRPYRKAYSPERALRNMREVIRDWFEPRVLESFMAHIALYPKGSLVELNTGEVAVVVEVPFGQADCPRVRVVRHPDGRRVDKPWDLDLSRDPSVRVARVLLEPEEISLALELGLMGDALFA